MLSPNGIRAIVFDLDGTLRYSRPTLEYTILACAIELGAADNPEARRRALRWSHYYWAQSPELMKDLETYQEKGDLFWLNYSTSLLSVFGCTPEAAQALSSQVEQKIQQVFHPEDWVPPEVPATLGLLKEAGFKLAVLSNRTTPCHEYLGTLGLQGFFDFIVVAGEVSSWKPDPHIFRHTLQRLDVLPAQAMYVGDNYYADVVGAQGVGMRPVLIDPERIFPEPGCAVIDGLAQLPNVLA